MANAGKCKTRFCNYKREYGYFCRECYERSQARKQWGNYAESDWDDDDDYDIANDAMNLHNHIAREMNKTSMRIGKH